MFGQVFPRLFLVMFRTRKLTGSRFFRRSGAPPGSGIPIVLPVLGRATCTSRESSSGRNPRTLPAWPGLLHP
jgi:hypothetical protein